MDQCIDYNGYVVVILNEGFDKDWAYDLQEKTEKNKLIYVPMDGVDDKYLHPDRFLVKNYDASLMNHFLWEDLLSKESQDMRLFDMIDKFIETKKPFVIEDYNFVVDEPFYDYSGGREE